MLDTIYEVYHKCLEDATPIPYTEAGSDFLVDMMKRNPKLQGVEFYAESILLTSPEDRDERHLIFKLGKKTK